MSKGKLIPMNDPFKALKPESVAVTAKATVPPLPPPDATATKADHPDYETPILTPIELKDFDSPPPLLPPKRYRNDADPLLIETLELMERLRDGFLIIHSAYDARDRVDAVIGKMCERVELPKGEKKS